MIMMTATNGAHPPMISDAHPTRTRTFAEAYCQAVASPRHRVPLVVAFPPDGDITLI